MKGTMDETEKNEEEANNFDQSWQKMSQYPSQIGVNPTRQCVS